MKIFTQFIAYTLCLQLTVGSFPIQNHLAYAFEEKAESVETNNDGGGSRSPASENLSMDDKDFAEGVMAKAELLEQTCTDHKRDLSKIAFGSVESVTDGATKIDNCADETKQFNSYMEKMDEIVANQEAVNEAKKKDPKFCATCGTGAPVENEAEFQGTDGAECDLATQKKFADLKCDTKCAWLSLVGADSNCSGDSHLSLTGCGKAIGNAFATAMMDLFLFLPKLVIAGVKLVGEWTGLRKAEDASSDKSVLATGMLDADIDHYQKDKEGFKRGLLARAGAFLADLSLELLGVGLYKRQAACTDCAGRADLSCGVLGTTASLFIGNGFIFGFQKGVVKGLASRIARASNKLFKGTKVAKYASAGANLVKKGGTLLAKPFVWVGNKAVKITGGVSQFTINKWKAFQKSAFYKTAKNVGNNRTVKITTKAVTAIPKHLVVKPLQWGAKKFKQVMDWDSRMMDKTEAITKKAMDKTLSVFSSKASKAAALAEKATAKEAFLAKASEQTLESLAKKDPLAEKVLEYRKKNKIAYEEPVSLHENKLGEIEMTYGKSKPFVLTKKEVEEWKLKLKLEPEATHSEVVAVQKMNKAKPFEVTENVNGDIMIKKGTETNVVDKKTWDALVKSGDSNSEILHNMRKSGSFGDANAIALQEVEELRMFKDASKAHTPEVWNKFKEDLTNNVKKLESSHLENVEHAGPASFYVNYSDNILKANQVTIDTERGAATIFEKEPHMIENVSVYKDGKMAIVTRKDGTYGFYDIASGKGKLVTNVSKKEAGLVDNLLGKESEDSIRQQMKTNLDLSGAKYEEKIGADGKKYLDVHLPPPCDQDCHIAI